MLQTMPDTIRFKYFKKDHIQQFNERGTSEGRRNTISQATISTMDEETYYPVQSHVVTDDNIRVKFVLNEKGETISFDLSPAEWDSLPYRNIAKPIV